MPSAYTEIIRHAVGSSVAEHLILRGHVVEDEDAVTAGLIHELCAPQDLIERASDRARAIGGDSLTAYRYSKRVLRHSVLDRITRMSSEIDEALLTALTSPDSVRARRRAYDQLRGRHS